jgi:hypothetical protein
MLPMNKLMNLTFALSVSLLAAGCNFTSANETNSPGSDSSGVVSVITPNPGGAPNFGSPSGMGLSTGNAAQSGGQGTGLMDFHHTGEYGTSGTITQPYSG